jgi:hypothetical protein
MECKVKKGIYILDDKALDWLEQQGNQSQYITDLILKDMVNNLSQRMKLRLIDEKLKDCVVKSEETEEIIEKINPQSSKIARNMINF